MILPAINEYIYQWKPGTVLNDPKNHGDRFLIPIMTQGVILKDKLLKSIMYLISSRTNRLLYLIIVLMISISAIAQSSDKNYVQTKTFLDDAGTIITGFLSIYVPMNLFLYVYKMSFFDSLIYSLPFVVACILVVAFLTFSKMRFSGDIFLR